MKINCQCLPCLVNQAVKTADMTNAQDKEHLFKKLFSYLSQIDFTETNPEIIGETFRILKEHTHNPDPYKETRIYYNKMFSELSHTFLKDIKASDNPFLHGIKYAIIGNIIDFNPIHNLGIKDIMNWFHNIGNLSLAVDHTERLTADISLAGSLLYLGDNCGEICLDKLLIQIIKETNPALTIYFGVRGEPVVNDSIEEDGYFVGMNQYARIISNGDYSLGTVLKRTSREFQEIYKNADVVIAKGQANYESLSEERDKKIYFLLMTKCSVIAKDIGVSEKSLVCMTKNSY